MSADKTTPENFRGLTIFELLTIGAIILASILWAFSYKGNLSNKADDAEREGRVSALKENLKAYVLENQTFPSDEQFKDDEYRKKLFSSYLVDQGQDALFDPKESSKLISYSAEPEGCDASQSNPCTKVTVGLKLSNGDLFIKFAIKPGTELQYLQQSQDNLNSSGDN